MPEHDDLALMRRALDLARQGTGLASPNPCVGAVIVDAHGVTLGEGSYSYDGLKHAEILALEGAGENARGASVYLNLEPCSHHGRTGPCAEALVKAGVARVIAAIEDPNPAVSGKGFELLRSAGIQVTVGIAADEARSLNEAFARHIRTRLPLVTLKTAMTLDGRIAPPPGESENPSALGAGGAVGGWITSTTARAHVHELRHAADAIMVGVGTVIADDPLLTDRTGGPRRRPLLRVIVDSRLRLPFESRIAKTCHDDVIVFCSFAEEKRKAELVARGIRVEQIALGTRDGRPDLQAIVRRLGEMDVTSLIIEGGAMVNGAALITGIVDKIFFYYAPKILGGSGSVPFAAGPGFRRMSEAAIVKDFRIHRFGEDFAVEGYVRDPWSE
jgi:diaminohydroxyphosphoribosylaminopyrimidine deaminase/5-amino-6-(5-phosphoribosylamino)uracil reductase